MMIISNLRSVRAFAKTVADRAWYEWWTNTDVSLAEYRSGIERMVDGDDDAIPSALVAHIGKQYAGSVLLIDNDLETRPQYSPWIAALWVEPEFRRQGVAGELIEAARGQAARLGHGTCYLCATPTNSPYYLARGFRLLEPGVDGLDVFAI
ncbi:GNAT family N-acetyltransferase [Mesorhizobium sp. BAC0120]|uniref:GNAT family N-acetyltransferase n=1 Tax=Mesorhizobium sp. BAC0120 TaxID=3090670 RepID=UPI00298CAB64|nr:GNAT family N-acetyltransferase [Mesorhizobium sp. BAC0120]MDW6021795.1 GNAT family N-acetyltransferase [Mesorhizobium sp. BAC0120]